MLCIHSNHRMKGCCPVRRDSDVTLHTASDGPVIPPVMKSEECVFPEKKCGNQDKHRNLEFEVRLGCHVTPPPHTHTSNQPSKPTLGATAVGNLSLNSRQEVRSNPPHPPPPPRAALSCSFSSTATSDSLHTVTVASRGPFFSSLKQKKRGLKPPAAAARPGKWIHRRRIT